MHKGLVLRVFVAAAVVALIVPGTAFGLVNEYGLSFAGQQSCAACHPDKAATVHSRFMRPGIVPSTPAGWTVFTAAGNPPVIAGTSNAYFNGGGTYPIADAAKPWVTLGDWPGAPTEYLIWKGSTTSAVNPWNIVEGLSTEPSGEWKVGVEDPAKGLWDKTYFCQRCHTLGATKPGTGTNAVPNPQVTVPASTTTGWTWARNEAKTVADFLIDPLVSQPGMGIQCESCHGTGLKSSPATTNHWSSGTELSHRMPAALQGTAGATSLSTLGNSQVCGQCHASYADVTGTLGIYGYTPNLPLRLFVNPNGLDKNGVQYTYVPTDAEFMANPTKYYLFPNGSNAKGHHFYYNEWSTSGHAFRGAYFNATLNHSEDPDGLVGGKAGHYNAKIYPLSCARCHTGEAYLKSKNDPLTATFVPTNANVGFMGQECIVCHDAHPAGVGAATNVRTPDPAGLRSNTGRTTGNASLCEDCHNWQYEVQGTAPSVKPQASLASRGGPSHPQRETLHGRSMLEVPSATEFMPGAKCEQCHMPKTNKSANRYSHGMHIMMPGDAQRWNAAAGYAGQDSCSGCHAGLTRSSLQAYIDGWHADEAAASAAAASAITAAQARTEFSLTDSANPGYILSGKATWNYKAAQGDGSGGVHNPPYVLAGLRKAVQLADSVGGSFQAVSASAPGAPGGTGFVSGRVIDGDGSGAAGAAITLVGGGSTVADADGNFSFSVAPTVTTAYQVKWERSSDPRTHLTSAPVTITVSQPAPAPAPATGTLPVYRFYNLGSGTHFYTSSEAEKANVIATMSRVMRYEGVAYVLNTAAPSMNVPLHRFYSASKGTHFYTSSEAEKANVIATMSGVWTYEGIAYYVSAGPAGTPVYRFLNTRTGTHFYTSSEAEKTNVVTDYAAMYRLEGVAFYLAP